MQRFLQSGFFLALFCLLFIIGNYFLNYDTNPDKKYDQEDRPGWSEKIEDMGQAVIDAIEDSTINETPANTLNTQNMPLDNGMDSDCPMKSPDVPLQTALEETVEFNREGYRVTLHHDYEITARVISLKARDQNSTDPLDRVLPFDFLLGWGPFNVPGDVAEIEFGHTGRWYVYEYTANFPFPPCVIVENVSLNHIMPADSEINQKLKGVKRLDEVVLKGKLLNIFKDEDNWNWRSSLSRRDEGEGATELLYVENVIINHAQP